MADGQVCRATDGTLASYTKHLGLQVKVTTVVARTGYAFRIGYTKSTNMLHYSNASSREKSRRYLVINGGLAWLLSQVGVVNNIVDRGTSCGVSLVVYQREEGKKQ